VTAVCLFAKAPEPWQAKTRLIPLVGARGAAALARAMLLDTWAMLQTLEWARPVLATSSGDSAGLALEPAPELWSQGQGDLGQRMERVLRRALERSPAALLIGGDLPGLPARLLVQARDALEAGADAVLGPAEDGGFFLIGLRGGAAGLRRPPGSLLEGVPWSAADTLRHTVRRLRRFGLTVELVQGWFDLDRPADVQQVVGLLGRKEITAPHTARVLRELELL
jgi:rSAM/selenodomain-associated transferase 1